MLKLEPRHVNAALIFLGKVKKLKPEETFAYCELIAVLQSIQREMQKPPEEK